MSFIGGLRDNSAYGPTVTEDTIESYVKPFEER